MSNRYFTFITTFLFSSSLLANELLVTTTPEKAEVFVSSLQAKSTPKKVGDTPFKMALKDLSANYADGAEMYIVEVVKAGHEPYRIVIPGFIKSQMTLDLTLKPKAELEEFRRIDKVATELFEVQRLIRSQNFQGATSRIDQIEKDFPKLSITKELRASSLYLQNDYKNALDYYKQAYLSNSENLDAYKMMIYLEKSLGIKKTSGGDK